ncbi:hypothetical protein JCM10213_005842 [Rhodosporidiobolus nylandii]
MPSEQRYGITVTPSGVRKRSKVAVVSSRPPSSASSRRRHSEGKEEERWTTDSEGEAGDVREERRDVQQLTQRRSTPSRRSSSSTTPSSSPFSLARALLRPFAKLAYLLLPFTTPVVPYLVLFGGLYLSLAVLRSYLHAYLASLPLPGFLLAPFAALSALPLPLPPLGPKALLTVPCNTLGILCPPGQGRQAKFELLSARAARTAKARAEHAVTVFDQLLELADPEKSVGLSLHPVEVWELATAVRYTSSLDDRHYLSTQLGELGDLSREVKDQVISLNAQGMNAMTWILHEFNRLEVLLSRASSSRLSVKEQAAYSDLLSSLFDRISLSLTELLTSLERAIPTATLASDSARRIFGAVRASEAVTREELEGMAWPVKLLDAVGGTKAKALNRDLVLASATAGALTDVWVALEDTRNSLKNYETHVGHFKAGVLGFHLSGHGLSLEDEVASLSTVMGEMRQVVERARAGRGGAKRARVAELGG